MGLYNNGQRCCAVERIYADNDVYDELIDSHLAPGNLNFNSLQL